MNRWLSLASSSVLLVAIACYTSASASISSPVVQENKYTDTADTSSFIQHLVVHTAQDTVLGGDVHETTTSPEPEEEPDDVVEEPDDVVKDTNSHALTEALGTDLLGDAFEPVKPGSGGHAHAEKGHKGHESMHHGYLVLIFIFGGLSLGNLLLMFQERFLTGVPYTCLLFVVGCSISVIHNINRALLLHYKDYHWMTWHSWYNSVNMFEKIDPHLLFYVFLPALVFSEAMSLNVTRVKACMGQTMLLAGPGVLIGTVLMGAFSHYVLPYHWDWPICLVLGAILAATDPVAVVALFKTLGVSPRLTMIISGESLFNDGTAVVCFQLMFKVALGATLTPQGVTIFFGHMTVVSILAGFVVGGLALWVISCCAFQRGHMDAMVQVMMTICCAYMCFLVSESELSASGILSLVSGGILLAAFVWPRFVDREITIIVWEAIEFMGNTMVFLLSGLLFADSCISRREHISRWDFVWLLVMYAATMLIRALTIMILWVPLQLSGHPITWQEGLVMVWGGLRGAVSLALAIVVDLDPKISHTMGTRVMFHVGGIAGLTLIINSTTCAKLLKSLGLTDEPEERGLMLQHIEQHMTRQALDTMQADLSQAADADVRFKDADVELLYSMVPKLRLIPMARTARHGQGGEKLRVAAKEQFYREVFLEVVQSKYWKDIDEGIIPKNFKVARILLQSKDAAMSNTHVKLNDWSHIQSELDVQPARGRVGRFLSQYSESPSSTWIPGLPTTFPSQNIINAWKVTAVLTFLEAHKMARKEVPHYFDVSDPLNSQVQRTIAEESLQECQKAEQVLSEVPESATRFGKSRMLAHKLIHLQIAKVGSLLHHGVISSSEATNLEDDLRDNLSEFQARAI